MENSARLPSAGSTPVPLDTWSNRNNFQKVLGSSLPILLLSGFICGFRTSPMIDNMSTIWQLIVFSWGVLFGIFVFVFAPTPTLSNVKKAIIVILVGLSFVANGSAAREFYVFSGITPHITQVLAPIAGSSDCVGRYSRPRIRVSPYPDKSIFIKTTRAICERYGSLDLHLHECVHLTVQTGRFGVRRMLHPLSIEACQVPFAISRNGS